MPKDEFDFDDPMELNGMALQTNEDTSEAMCECFVEEFLRMGYGPKQILALFRNPHYLGMNLVLQKRGESFVRDVITEQFALRGRPVSWPAESRSDSHFAERGCVRSTNNFGSQMPEAAAGAAHTAALQNPVEDGLTDPMGAAIPRIEV
jgi:hypothetical protein